MNFINSRHIDRFFQLFSVPWAKNSQSGTKQNTQRSYQCQEKQYHKPGCSGVFVYLCVYIYGKPIFQNSKYADLLQSLKSHNGGLNVICCVIWRLKASFSKVLSSFRMSGSCLVIKVCLLSKECLLSLITLECLGKQTRKTAH